MRNTSGNSLAMTSTRVSGEPSDGMYCSFPRCGSDSISEQFQGNGCCAKQATRPAVEQLRVGTTFELPSPDSATIMKVLRNEKWKRQKRSSRPQDLNRVYTTV